MNLFEKIACGGLGEKLLLLGNEAIARGLIEAGVIVATTYPGTPSSEIGNTLAVTSSKYGKPRYFEFSTNEKVAFEVAASAAVAGLRSCVFMKHVGLNVAADPLMSSAYIGTNAGFTVITADDPGCWSSQNEQDNRYYAYLANLPMLEPSNSQEAKDMIRDAFIISEKLELPVIFRVTTRVSHTRGKVILGKIEIQKPKKFVKNPGRYVPIPAVARKRRLVLIDKINKAREISEQTNLNRVEGSGDIGIITSGVSYNYAMEAIAKINIEASTLKLGMTHPLPENKIKNFIKDKKQVIIIEELEPLIENTIRSIAQRNNVKVKINGKHDNFFPLNGEFSTDIVVDGIKKALNMETNKQMKIKQAEKTPFRPPIFCPGCPHMASYHIVKRVLSPRTIWASDIGCYTLAINKPFQMADILYCMGSSIGAAMGMSKADKVAVAFIGDSTFFHSGLPELINAVYNRHNVLVVVLDNETTAMTGHQPHPGTGRTGMGEKTKVILPEMFAEALGIPYEVADPYNIALSVKALRRLLKRKGEGPALIVFRRSCALIRPVEQVYIINDKCTGCFACINSLGCPALRKRNGNAIILSNLCRGCGVCSQVCPFEAIESVNGLETEKKDFLNFTQ